MCGRYAITLPPEAMRGLFDLDAAPAMTPRWNVAPSQQVPIIIADEAGRRLEMVRWGLHPAWMKEPPGAKSMINARSETAFDKPFFRDAMKRRRALVPADGFYEWARTQTGKSPYYIRRADGAPMAIAGIWERWGAGETLTPTAGILTMAANADVAPVHDRMPAALDKPAFAAWLDPKTPREILEAIIADAAQVRFERWPVSRAVNSPANDGPALIVPVA